MTTVFTPTIDIDLRPQPLVPTDPRKLEQVNMRNEDDEEKYEDEDEDDEDENDDYKGGYDEDD